MRKKLNAGITSLIILLLGALAGTASAQEQKIGYIDSDYILSKLPEYDGVQQNLQRLSENWRSELQQMDQEIEELRKEFQAKEILYTDEVRKEKKQEIQNKVQQREQYLQNKFGADGEYFQRQKELLAPIQRKVFQAVNKIAERDGYDFVFDRAGDVSIMYSRGQWNLSNDVLRELGVNVDEASN